MVLFSFMDKLAVAKLTPCLEESACSNVARYNRRPLNLTRSQESLSMRYTTCSKKLKVTQIIGLTSSDAPMLRSTTTRSMTF